MIVNSCCTHSWLHVLPRFVGFIILPLLSLTGSTVQTFVINYTPSSHYCTNGRYPQLRQSFHTTKIPTTIPTTTNIVKSLYLLDNKQLCFTTDCCWCSNGKIKVVRHDKTHSNLEDVNIVDYEKGDNINNNNIESRRNFWFHLMKFRVAIAVVPSTTTSLIAVAAAVGGDDSTTTVITSTNPSDGAGGDETIFIRSTDQYGYKFRPPSTGGFANGPIQKPLKTHLDECNFISTTISGYQFGITVDPVRINSLSEFGSPEQIAAKVVLAEVNRDGVFDVKLMEDPISGSTLKDDDNNNNNNNNNNYTYDYVQLNYLSTGKRGRIRYVAKFFIQKQKLYVLTVHCKDDDYEPKSNDIRKAVQSFQLL